MINLPTIVLVDDKREELDVIHQSFVAEGFPCLPIQYVNEPGNVTGLDHVNLSHVTPRIIITDLNLQEQPKVEAQTLVGPIHEVLQKLTTNEPYLLYFWSKNEAVVNDVVALLESRFKGELQPPLLVGTLSKSEFMSPQGQVQLKERVKSLLTDAPLMRAFLEWEGRIDKAARMTTSSLFELASPGDYLNFEQYKDSVNEELGDLLAVIGNETIGVKNAKSEPEVAIEQGLAPVLHDHLNLILQDVERDVWLTAVPKIGERLDINAQSKAKLNSFYHVDNVSENNPEEKRGTWVELNADYFGNQASLTSIKLKLGEPIKNILHQEFLDSNQGSKAQRSKARDATKLGFLELSAECDQAQRKTKLHRFCLTALIPVEFEQFTTFRDGSSNTAHSGIYRLPNLFINGAEYIVKVSFMYQIGTKPENNKWFGEPKFRLKDQILADISFKASQHASRPGIIRFD